MIKVIITILCITMLTTFCASNKKAPEKKVTIEKECDVTGDPLYLSCLRSIISGLISKNDEYTQEKMDEISDYCERYVRLRKCQANGF